MRRAGNPWELLGALIVAAAIASAIGGTAFKVVIWLVFAMYVLVQVAPYVAALGRGLDRLPWGQPKENKNFFNDIDNPVWKAYIAMRSKNVELVRPYIERDGVDPFAHFPPHMNPVCEARTLYDLAIETSFEAARIYFEEWRSNRADQHR